MHNFYCVSINVATRLTTSTTISTGQLKVMEPYSYSNLILQRASTASGTLLRMFWDKLWRRNTLQISLWAQHWKRAFIMTLISNSSTPQSHELHDHSHMHPHPITQRSFTTMSLTPFWLLSRHSGTRGCCYWSCRRENVHFFWRFGSAERHCQWHHQGEATIWASCCPSWRCIENVFCKPLSPPSLQ